MVEELHYGNEKNNYTTKFVFVQRGESVYYTLYGTGDKFYGTYFHHYKKPKKEDYDKVDEKGNWVKKVYYKKKNKTSLKLPS